MSPAADKIVLSGRYRLVEPLATGGMGTVWRAYDDVLDRPVAVKEVLLPPGLDDEAREVLRQRTLREARAAAKLRHAAIVTIFDVVEQDDRPWIVMELVPSQSLEQRIRARGPLPPAEAAAVGLRILDALVTAQAAGVQHRDIKPANVLLADDGRVVLTDFGIARHIGDQTLTSAGLLVGSPNYLAPERARGLPTPGLQSDLWSLGATLYAAVEGQPPFERNGPLPTLAAVVMDEPPPPQRAGPLRPVIDGLLVKDPRHRLDADRARAMLQRVLRPGSAGFPPGTAPAPRPAPDPTRPLPVTPGPAPERPGGPVSAATPVGTPAAAEPEAVQPAPPREDTPPPRPRWARRPGRRDQAPGGAPAIPTADSATRADADHPATARPPDAAAPTDHAAEPAPAGPPAEPAPAGPPAVPAGDGGSSADPTEADVAAAEKAPAEAASASDAEAPVAAAAAAGSLAAATPPDTGAPTSARTGSPDGVTDADTAVADHRPGTATATDTTGTPTETGTTAKTGATADAGTATGTGAAASIGVAAGAGAAVGASAGAAGGPTAAPGPASRPGAGGPSTTGLAWPADHRRANRRRALLAVAVVAILAAVALLLPQVLDDDRQQAAPPSPSAGGTAPPAGSGSPEPTDQGAAPVPGQTGTGTGTVPPTSRPAPTGTAGPAGGSAAVPAGFSRYTDPTRRFQVAVPAGWTAGRGRTAAQVRFDDPTSGRYLMIETSDDPQADPYTNWLSYERQFSATRSNYENLGIDRVDYGADQGWRTADWEFRLGGTHVLNRNILVNPRRAHALYWSTPESLWGTAESRRILQVAADSFVPAPVPQRATSTP